MQVILSKPIVGRHTDDNGKIESRMYAMQGETLDVILQNKTHFICDSNTYPNTSIIVFPNQCKEVLINKEDEVDMFADEKFYNVYEEPEEKLETNDEFDN
jgi:hypothetical protein